MVHFSLTSRYSLSLSDFSVSDFCFIWNKYRFSDLLHQTSSKKVGNTKTYLANIGGLVSSALGIGCAACGSVVITTVLSLFSVGGLILLSPLQGAGFGILGIGLLVWSINNLAKRDYNPLVYSTDL